MAWGPYLLLVAILTAAYLPPALGTYAWSDDYSYLTQTSTPGSQDLRNHLFGDARPGLYLLIETSFAALDGRVEGLRWLRVLALLGLILAASLLLRILPIPTPLNKWVLSVALGLGFLTPSFQMYIHWATAWPYSWSILIGLIAWLLWERAGLTRRVLAVILLAFAISIYPVSALLFLAAISVRAVLAATSSGDLIRILKSSSLLAGAGTALWFLLARLLVNHTETTLSEKVSPINSLTDPMGQFVWFATRHVGLSLRPMLVSSPEIIEMAVAGAIVLLIIVAFLRVTSISDSRPNFRVAILLLLPLLSIAPLVVAPQQVDHRFIPGPSWFVVVTLTLAIFWGSKRLWESKVTTHTIYSEVLGAALVAGVIAFCVWTTWERNDWLMTTPYLEKNVWLESQLADCDSLKEIAVIPATRPGPKYANVGAYSEVTDMSQSWVVLPSVRVVIKGSASPESAAVTFAKPDTLMARCTLDVNDFLKEQEVQMGK